MGALLQHMVPHHPMAPLIERLRSALAAVLLTALVPTVFAVFILGWVALALGVGFLF